MAQVLIGQFVQTRRLLQEYFDQDGEKRFVFEGPVDSGSFSLVWKLKYRPRLQIQAKNTPRGFPLPYGAAYGDPGYIVLKTEKVPTDLGEDTIMLGTPEETMFSSSTRDSIVNEKAWLEVLKWAKHVVKVEEVPKDPLQQVTLDVQAENWPNWSTSPGFLCFLF
ncbi:hypothetical protein F4779DRAFT_636691 [Xylariaceae sp. FL0662B]|nr:hypothetical protein F4779DRAFT_636691 [Xylariaceae sp. FL0662B]